LPRHLRYKPVKLGYVGVPEVSLRFSVIIPTYKRCQLLKQVFEGLKAQTYCNFEVLVVVKSSRDGTEELVKSYKQVIDMRIIPQQEGFVTHALNLGLKEAKGDLVVFLDDDAVPNTDWLQKHLQTYEQLGVAAVAGDAVPVKLENGKLERIDDLVKPPYVRLQDRIGFRLWDKPLPKTEQYFVCISRAGTVSLAGNFAYHRSQGKIVSSFLGQGANMSVTRKSVLGFFFDEAWISGARWEQVLAWNIWRQGGKIVFNPQASVNHIVHGQTLSRDLQPKKARLFQIENELFFYRLYMKEKSFSYLLHLLSVLHRSVAMFKNRDLPRIEGIVIGNFLGLKFLALRRTGNERLILADLKKLK
jgi:glycosyltransferase involved in cell wall biosynthesis